MASLWVMLGSALGGLARYWLGVGIAAWTGPGFPWGTLLINVLGSFVIGLFAAALGERGMFSDALRQGQFLDFVDLRAFVMRAQHRGEGEGPGNVLIYEQRMRLSREEYWAEMQALTDWRRAQSHFAARRAAQSRSWFEAEVRAGLLARLGTGEARSAMARLGDAVEAGATDPVVAAAAMLEVLEGSH